MAAAVKKEAASTSGNNNNNNDDDDKDGDNNNNNNNRNNNNNNNNTGKSNVDIGSAEGNSASPPAPDGFAPSSKFLATSSLMRSFSMGQRPSKPGDRVVYVDGAWDLFHAGHHKFLEKARAMGDYLIVGVFNDAVINAYRGVNYPIMNLNERVLSVMGCR